MQTVKKLAASDILSRNRESQKQIWRPYFWTKDTGQIMAKRIELKISNLPWQEVYSFTRNGVPPIQDNYESCFYFNLLVLLLAESLTTFALYTLFLNKRTVDNEHLACI